MDPITIARYGMMAAERRFSASAERVAQMGQDPSVDPAAETVNQIQASEEFRMNLNVVKFSEDMFSSLLDIQKR